MTRELFAKASKIIKRAKEETTSAIDNWCVATLSPFEGKQT